MYPDLSPCVFVDVDFEPNRSETDDEETIENEEADNGDDEVSLSQRNGVVVCSLLSVLPALCCMRRVRPCAVYQESEALCCGCIRRVRPRELAELQLESELPIEELLWLYQESEALCCGCIRRVRCRGCIRRVRPRELAELQLESELPIEELLWLYQESEALCCGCIRRVRPCAVVVSGE